MFVLSCWQLSIQLQVISEIVSASSKHGAFQSIECRLPMYILSQRVTVGKAWGRINTCQYCNPPSFLPPLVWLCHMSHGTTILLAFSFSFSSLHTLHGSLSLMLWSAMVAGCAWSLQGGEFIRIYRDSRCWGPLTVCTYSDLWFCFRLPLVLVSSEGAAYWWAPNPIIQCGVSFLYQCISCFDHSQLSHMSSWGFICQPSLQLAPTPVSTWFILASLSHLHVFLHWPSCACTEAWHHPQHLLIWY